MFSILKIVDAVFFASRETRRSPVSLMHPAGGCKQGFCFVGKTKELSLNAQTFALNRAVMAVAGIPLAQNL
jgi:hypothetical protein